MPRSTFGNVEKSRQRRSLALPKRLAQTSSPFCLTFGLTDLPLFAAFALTYWEYAPRVKTAAAFPSTPLRIGLDEPFGKDRFFLNIPSHDVGCGPEASMANEQEIFNRPLFKIRGALIIGVGLDSTANKLFIREA